MINRQQRQAKRRLRERPMDDTGLQITDHQESGISETDWAESVTSERGAYDICMQVRQSYISRYLKPRCHATRVLSWPAFSEAADRSWSDVDESFSNASSNIQNTKDLPRARWHTCQQRHCRKQFQEHSRPTATLFFGITVTLRQRKQCKH